MKILLLSKSSTGGAGQAAFRLNLGLRNAGHTSVMAVHDSTVEKRSNGSIINAPSPARVLGITNFASTFNSLSIKLDRLPRLLYPRRDREAFFSVNWIPDRIGTLVKSFDPDVVNLHWIQNGYVRIESLATFHKPIVWTLHDMWAFTGGCDYDQGCGAYEHSCGACPRLESNNTRDLSNWIWRRKQKAWKGLDLTIVTPSRWLASCARSSSLFGDKRIEVIPNGIDLSRFCPFDMYEARSVLDLPLHKKLILCGAWSDDERKGLKLLRQSLKWIYHSDWRDEIELVFFGPAEQKAWRNIGFKVHHLGWIDNTEKLALIYSAADVFIAPSRQDNLPTTVLETLACGTPCVAFDIGGMSDMIDHRRNGYLVKDFSTEDLAKGIIWVIEDSERHSRLSFEARNKAENNFGLDTATRKYEDLFQDLCGTPLQGNR